MTISSPRTVRPVTKLGLSRMAPENLVPSPAGEVAPQASAPVTPMQVHSCSRIGLTANPPGFRLSLGDWFRRR
ncbi:hypothetical protein MHPYR_170022 [uncultured Mycobacterium sp.]|uniref:Uncharacterized protein n=1 Tax=uncultured Mycobacterium sp. TaxID=171292 RepID=A0A1Y5PBD7_9MYCO|nr:hypothetical protein MHPYR_170022 [uncultured Mycobacterium sp.]